MKRLQMLLPVLLALGLLLQVLAAQAFPVNQCAADRANANLNCTANDVSITGMAVVGDTTSCVGGTNVTLNLRMTVNFGTPDRYDVGIFIANDGKDPATKSSQGGAASCAVSVLPIASPFQNLDGPTDTCGDGGGRLSGIHYMSNVTVPCQSLPGASGNLYIPFVVSWDNQASPSGAMCTSNADPMPNTGSKCNAPTVIQGSVAVVVVPTITMTDNRITLSSGDSTSYIVTITNTTGAELSNAVFTDPGGVTGITVNSVSCTPGGGATCPASSTVAAMQGAGIAIPTMPVGGSVTFSVGATLTGNPGDTRTNTAIVTVGSAANSASDTDTVVGTIAILPTSLSSNGDKGSTVSYSYTLYNNGASADTISLAAVSSRGWSRTLSPTSVNVPAGGSTTITLTVSIPSGASIGDVDTTTITATSGNNPSKTATATAVTTVTTVLTLTPSNTGSVGPGSSTYYAHRVQSNASSSKAVSLTPSFTAGACTGWTSALYESDKATSLASPVTLTANGGYRDFTLKVTAPATAAINDSCTATLTAAYTSGAPNAVSVTDVTAVKKLVLYSDPGYTAESYIYPTENNVYAMGFYAAGFGTNYEYRWYNPSNQLVRTSPASTTGATFPDTWSIPTGGPLGTWTVKICRVASDCLAANFFAQTNFYVGPDHLSATYSGTPTANSNFDVNLSLHARDHAVPMASGALVVGSPPTTADPLNITVTVSGSATIVSTTLSNAVIVGQTVTGRLDSTTGTAVLTVSDAMAETVTITPATYNHALYGSPIRDEAATVTFAPAISLDHFAVTTSGNGVTCQPETVTITAHNSAHGLVTLDNTTTLSLAAMIGTGGGAAGNGSVAAKGNWSAPAGLAGTFVAGTADSGAATYTFPATGASSVTLRYQNTWGQTVNFNVSAGAVTERSGTGSAENPYDADQGWSLAGFRFVDAANNAIGTQTAGITSGTYYLQPVLASCTTYGAACAGICADTTKAGPFTNGASLNIGMAYVCTDPATCSCTNAPAVCAASSLPTLTATNNNASWYVQGNSSSVSSYATVPLTFATAPAALCSGGTPCTAAPFTFNFTDVGKVTLNASYTVAPGGGGTGTSAPSTPQPLIGSSAPFLAQPYGFSVIACTGSTPCTSANASAVDGTGTVFAKAGATFNATIKAVAYCPVPPCITTPNFGSGTGNATETVTLSSSLVAPSGGSAGVLTGTGAGASTLTRSAFTDGVASLTDLTWSEVGVMSLTAGNSTFAGIAVSPAASGTSGNIGRFTPHHFGLGNIATTGSIAAGTSLLTVGSAVGISTGAALTVVGAGSGGGPLVTTVGNVAGTAVTLAAAATTAVAGADVYFHDMLGAANALQTRSDFLPATGSIFTYMGEPMRLGFTVTAYNGRDGKVTRNYVGNFAKLNAGTGGLADADWFSTGCSGTTQCMGLGAVQGTTGLSDRLGLDTAAASGSASPTSSWTGGVGSFTVFLKFGRKADGTPDGPYDTLRLGGMPRDSDGITLPGPTDADLTDRVDMDATAGNTLASNADGTNERRYLFDTKVRYGRIKLDNAFGSEKLALAVPATTQYYAGAALGWKTNTDDGLTLPAPAAALNAYITQTTTNACFSTGSCSSASDATTVGNVLLAKAAGDTLNANVTTPSYTDWASGANGISLSAPTGGAIGRLTITEVVPAYLKFKWGGSATDIDPTAKVSFGVYKGNSKFIYIREQY